MKHLSESSMNRKMKALVIHPGRIDDMGDLLAVARAEGRKAFGTNGKIRVHPVAKEVDGCFVVVVEEIGCTGTQEQGKDDVGA